MRVFCSFVARDSWGGGRGKLRLYGILCGNLYMGIKMMIQ